MPDLMLDPFALLNKAQQIKDDAWAKKHANVGPGSEVKRSLIERQIEGCNTYGLDFQDGGNYFINTNSNDSFTFVSSFVGCQNDTASVMLINQNTGDQYDCGSVPTVPDNAPELATCPVDKDEIASGDFLIIAVGNNGNGTPFAYQREFNISAGPQQTITYYYTPTVTSTPIVITTSTSVANYTTKVPNTLSTVTALSPVYTQTITPPRPAVTQVSTSTETFTHWSQVDTSTATVVTPTCRTSLRPLHPDPICTVFPNKLQIPVGVKSTGVQRRAVPFGKPAPTPASTSSPPPHPTSTSYTASITDKRGNTWGALSYSMYTYIGDTSTVTDGVPVYPITSISYDPDKFTDHDGNRWQTIGRGNWVYIGRGSTTPDHPVYPLRPHTTASSTKRSLRGNDPYHTGQGGTGPMQHLRERDVQEAQHEDRNIHKRAPDATAITVTSPANTTVTLTAGQPSTETNIEAFTSTYFIMDTAPQTVFVGQPVQTVTAAVAPVETRVQTSFARAYETRTFGLTWTQTLTSTPAAALESCRAVGGHFGRWW